jgi:branched-chain amino acid transport system substrate-binding protein
LFIIPSKEFSVKSELLLNISRVTALFLPLLAALFSSSTSLHAENAPLKIGVVLCLTGGCQATGTHALNGLMLARDEINAQGGILNRRVELVVQDSREVDSPSHAVSAYRQLRLDPEITLFVGPSWSIGGLAVAPVAVRDPVILMAPTIGLETFNETGSNIFNLWPHDSVSTKALAAYAIEKGWRRAAVISNTQPWESQLAQVFRKEFAQLGGTETDFFEFSSSDNLHLRAVAAKVRVSKPDLIFMTNYSQLGLTGRALKELNVQSALMTILLEDKQIEVANGSLEGLLFASYEDSARDFISKYTTRFKLVPDLGADTGYDTLYVYKDAIERAQSFDPAVLKNTLLTTQYNGASGAIRFDSKGGVIKTPIFKHLKGSERIRN